MKALRIAGLMLVCGSAMAIPAMAEPAQRGRGTGAPSCNTLSCDVQGDWERTKNLLLGLVNAMPDDKWTFKPTPAQQTFGYIAQHLASDNYFFCERVSGQKPTRAVEDTATAPDAKAAWPKDKLVMQLKASYAWCQQVTASLNDAKLLEEIEIQGRDQSGNPVTRKVSRVTGAFGHVRDQADHYSQIANYMRANGWTPPSAIRPPGR